MVLEAGGSNPLTHPIFSGSHVVAICNIGPSGVTLGTVAEPREQVRGDLTRLETTRPSTAPIVTTFPEDNAAQNRGHAGAW